MEKWITAKPQTPHCQDGAHLFGAKDVDYNPNATRQRNELRWEGEDFSEPKSMRTVMEHFVKSWKNNEKYMEPDVFG